MSERMPPKRRRTPNERGMTEEEILRDRSGLDPMARYPFATSRDPGYVVGGPQMTDPRHFELMQRNREQARTQGTRLKKGGPVKKYQKGGAVEEGKDKYPSERSRLEKEAAILRRQRERFDTEQDPTGDRQAIFNRPFVAERPSPFYPLIGRRVESPQRQMEQERSRRQEEANQRIDRARERLDDRITETEGRLSSMGSKENKAAYKKGGKVGKYAGGGMVEIEIKVGGGGKHKMSGGSMMEDHEMEEGEEEYKKGGRVKKMAKGGATGGKKFIQKAIKKPGALREQLGAKPGQKIPAKKLAAAAKAPGKLGQRARFAQTLAKMRKK